MLVLAAALLLSTAVLAGCLDDGGPSPPGDGDEEEDVPTVGRTPTEGLPPVQTTVRVQQETNQTTYWVLPGPRRLSPQVFGNESQPRATGDWQKDAAPPPVRKTLEDLPFLVGAPTQVRQTRGDGSQVFTAPTPFSDQGVPTNGMIDVTYEDRVPYDVGAPHDARDSARIETTVEAPNGDTFRVVVKELLQPPIPGYETGGGVITSAFHHGLTDTGTPLVPRVFTYGGLWGQADLYRNGEKVESDHVFHAMTTQIVRNSTYGLAIDEELPLRPSETITGQVHHTHWFFTPVEVTPEGPEFDPVDTNFTLENDEEQPFIHAMYEEDEIVEGPFKDWTFPQELPVETPTLTRPPVQTEVHVTQEPGNTTYWVTPGPRPLSPQVFGAEGNERLTGDWQRQAAPPPFKNDILAKSPFLVGAPTDVRETRDDGTQVYAAPTPFGDDGIPVDGALDVRYQDRVPYDIGAPHDAQDSVELTVNFTDPQGTEYRIDVKDQLVQPPIPGYETGNGVITSSWHHGQTHTGTPLMPKVFTYGAFWGEADLYANGTKVEESHVVHFMTTQQVRQTDYALAQDEDLPLRPGETITGQVHHTHGFYTPINVTDEGPVHDPVDTNFTLPNGENQPFIHIMFEEDEIQAGPFAEWTFGAGPGDGDGDGDDVTDVDRVVHVNGTEYDFTPTNITVTEGETVKVVFRNAPDSAQTHNWGVGQFGARTDTIQPGETASVTFTADESGTFPVWCSVAGHRDAGMEGHVHSEAE